MAIKFTDTKGAAQKGADAYKFKDGEQTLRIFGDILPRYVYWVKGTNNKDIPLECLSFDREKEKFTNVDKDHVQDYLGQDKKCSWAYAVMCIDPTDGKAKVLNLKKKLFQQIMDAAQDLGDPTDPDGGWDINFKKAKNGPLAFNVEYTLNVLRCKHRALTDDERAAIAGAKPIEELIPRPTSDEIKALLEKITSGVSDDAEPDASTKEAINDLGQD
jgi:hypothetical protein